MSKGEWGLCKWDLGCVNRGGGGGGECVNGSVGCVNSKGSGGCVNWNGSGACVKGSGVCKDECGCVHGNGSRGV